jgi:hypothetical protein
MPVFACLTFLSSNLRCERRFTGMGYPVKDAWHHWTYTSEAGYKNQVAGYATAYDVSAQGSVSDIQLFSFLFCYTMLFIL